MVSNYIPNTHMGIHTKFQSHRFPSIEPEYTRLGLGVWIAKEMGKMKKDALEDHEDLEDHEYQREAVNSALTDLNIDSRCQLHMAPGSGKTVVSLQIHEKIKSTSTLFCAPSIHLVYQSLKSWAKFRTTKYAAMVVCSGRMSKADKEELSELRASNVVVSTDAKEIGEFLARKGNKVIFSTYKSLIKIATAVNKSDFSFELGIFDEAHHIAGHIEKDATICLKDDIISITKRVFLTATPRIAPNKFKGDDNWLGMENENHYGKVSYTLPFRTAVRDKILTDYKLLITLVDKKTVDSFNVDATSGGVVATFNEKAALVGTTQAVIEKGLKKGLTFHNSIKNASSFSAYLRDAFTKLGYEDSVYVDTLNCNHGIEHKAGVLNSLETNEKPSIITNVKVLGEGYDFSALDFIVIVDPKSSQIDIVQNIGRVMRKHPGKEVGTIILPIVIEKYEDDSELEESSHGAIVKVINALKSYDGMLRSDIGKSHEGLSTYKKYEQFVLEKVEVLSIGDEKKFNELYKKIKLKVVDIAAGSVEKWIDGFEQWCDEHERIPSRSSGDNPDKESLLAVKLSYFTCSTSPYKSSHINRVKKIVAKHTPSTEGLCSIPQIAADIGKGADIVRACTKRVIKKPALTLHKGRNKYNYYSKEQVDLIKAYYKSYSKGEDDIFVKDAVKVIGITKGYYMQLRKMYNLPKPKITVQARSVFTKMQFKWWKEFIATANQHAIEKATVARNNFIRNNPYPA